MPIRFRCTSCRRLLGIARRKAGTVVKCPDCGTDLIVPTEVTAAVPSRGQAAGLRGLRRRTRPDRGSTTEPIPELPPPPRPEPAKNGHGPAPRTPESLPLFERPDFEALLNPAVKQAAGTIPPAVPGPVAVQAKEQPKPAPKPPVPDEAVYDLEPVGLVISKANLTAVAVVVVVLIGLAFAAGYLLAAARLPAG